MFCEVAQHSTEELLQSRDEFLQVMALFRVEDKEQAEVEQVFRRVLEQLGSLFDSTFVRWQDLIRFILGWAYNRRPEKERATWQKVAEQVQADEQRRRETKMQGMTIADAIRGEGRAEGKAKAVLRMGRQKWGEPDLVVLQAIQAIHDEARLDRMLVALIGAQSWADLLNVT